MYQYPLTAFISKICLFSWVQIELSQNHPKSTCRKMCTMPLSLQQTKYQKQEDVGRWEIKEASGSRKHSNWKSKQTSCFGPAPHWQPPPGHSDIVFSVHKLFGFRHVPQHPYAAAPELQRGMLCICVQSQPEPEMKHKSSALFSVSWQP